MGSLGRMTQWKTKASSNNTASQADNISSDPLNPYGFGINADLGLYAYPVLQAADILLYQATHVPVGEDQAQHLELSRLLAKRFNSKFKADLIEIPQTLLTPTKRVMSLKEPTKKMSKSDSNHKSTIFMTDDPDVIKSKISKATTDSIKEIYYDPDSRPGVSNLLEIYSAFDSKSRSPSEIAETVFKGLNNQNLKMATTDLIVSTLGPIKQEFNRIKSDPEYVFKVLEKGEEKAKSVSSTTLNSVKKLLGLYY
ncbi:Tryptophan-tRNA ligase, mitochondrial [Smittium mucronatum]|uniref:tryptophan--tRNA ligase n=1 Tax=Smittium mucronatum TaxID=133383 RepID=A0A1R0GPI5_9FUNG|nr:Tryptophan-tRNA ligase, mitochondrial [Smittium mucronatum]